MDSDWYVFTFEKHSTLSHFVVGLTLYVLVNLFVLYAYPTH